MNQMPARQSPITTPMMMVSLRFLACICNNNCLMTGNRSRFNRMSKMQIYTKHALSNLLVRPFAA